VDISQTIVQGGIGVSALVFALYIFNRCMDQMKEVTQSVKDIVEEMKKHDEHVLEELRDIVSNNQKKSDQ